jgi:nitroreductase
MFIDLLRKRRSIRQFQEKPVEREKIDILTEAALRAPSSRSLYPWEILVVQNKETLAALAEVKPHGAAFLKNAPLAVVVCGDPAKCDVWIEDCSIVSILIHLAATDLGLGSCWIQLRLREYNSRKSSSQRAAEILGIQSNLEVQTIIAIGYAKKEAKGHDATSLPGERLHFERFGEKG